MFRDSEEKWSFCLDNEAEVQNEHTLGYYLSLVASVSR